MPLKWLWMWTHWRLVRSYINGLSWSFYWLHIIFLKPSMSKLALETGLVFAPLRKLFVTFFIRSLWQLHVIFLKATMGKIICDARFVSGFSFVKKYVVASWRVVVFRLKIKQKITICNVILCIYVFETKCQRLFKVRVNFFGIVFLPKYISDLFVVRNNLKNLWGANKLVIPRKKTSNFGLKSTPFIGSKVWNSLPDESRSTIILKVFKNAVRELHL